MNPTFTRQLAVATSLLIVTANAQADITGFKDYEEWKQAVGSYQTIDFTGWEQYTVITDQYSHLGVTFTDGNDYILNYGYDSFPKDGSGLHGNWADRQITVQFDSPQLWVGIDHPGSATIDLFSGDDLIGTFDHNWGGIGLFTGVISTIPFDRARIYRLVTNNPPIIDDLHWGVPAPGALAVLAFAALLGPSRRRRHGATRL